MKVNVYQRACVCVLHPVCVSNLFRVRINRLFLPELSETFVRLIVGLKGLLGLTEVMFTSTLRLIRVFRRRLLSGKTHSRPYNETFVLFRF